MRYLSLVLLAMLLVCVVAGCGPQGGPETNLPGGNTAVTGADTTQVATEAGAEVDSAVLDESDSVEIGEMI